MEKTRVKKSEKYWYVVNDCEGVYVEFAHDNCLYSDKVLFESGNYFHTKEEAETMVRKLRAVLKGADVIEWPKELDVYLYESNYTETYHQDQVIKDLVGTGMLEMESWLRNKIVK